MPGNNNNNNSNKQQQPQAPKQKQYKRSPKGTAAAGARKDLFETYTGVADPRGQTTFEGIMHDYKEAVRNAENAHLYAVRNEAELAGLKKPHSGEFMSGIMQMAGMSAGMGAPVQGQQQSQGQKDGSGQGQGQGNGNTQVPADTVKKNPKMRSRPPQDALQDNNGRTGTGRPAGQRGGRKPEPEPVPADGQQPQQQKGGRRYGQNGSGQGRSYGKSYGKSYGQPKGPSAPKGPSIPPGQRGGGQAPKGPSIPPGQRGGKQAPEGPSIPPGQRGRQQGSPAGTDGRKDGYIGPRVDDVKVNPAELFEGDEQYVDFDDMPDVLRDMGNSTVVPDRHGGNTFTEPVKGAAKAAGDGQRRFDPRALDPDEVRGAAERVMGKAEQILNQAQQQSQASFGPMPGQRY